MPKIRFTARLRPSGRGVGGHRGSIVRMGGVMMLGVTKAIMAEAGAGPGDVLDVVIEKDEAPREVEVPPDLTKALKRKLAARAVWDGLSFSHRREYVSYIVEAKKEETRARRVERTIQALTGRR
jgi:uncharacterized protein YdeI (YjbR/CyaY-like superfamily)